MRSMSALALAFALVFVAATAAAQPPQMPTPAAEMSQLAFFEGTWSCEGKMNETPFGPASTMTSTAEIHKDLGGFWQSGVIKGSAPKMPPFEGRFHVTYDPGAKNFVMMWLDSMGMHARSTSSGWKGDTMVYEGDSHGMGQTIKTRDTFTKAGPAAMKHTWEMQMGGKWISGGEESCKKK